MASRAEAEADPGWLELIEFLSVAGLKDDLLQRTLAQLAAHDVTNLVMLRCSFSALATDLKAGTRTKISNARSLPNMPSVGRSSSHRRR